MENTGNNVNNKPIITKVSKEEIQEELKNLSKQIDNISTVKLILFSIITLYIFLYVWTCKIILKLKAVNLSKNSKIILWVSYILMLLFVVKTAFNIHFPVLDEISYLSMALGPIFTYTAINTIKKYVYEKYHKKLKVNHFGAIIFGVVYLNFFINTLDKRIKLKKKESK